MVNTSDKAGLRIAPNLTLPLDAITETFAILARRGSGKTYLGNVLAEEIITAGYPAIIIDPLGVWWGLRSSANGEGEGLPVVIFGGEHADVPLDERSGELVADVIVSERISAIIDLSLLSKSASRRFLEKFVAHLYRINREPAMVLVDEADSFAPQTRLSQDGMALLGAMEDLVRRGRVRGLGVTLITQRPAVLHKDVLTQAGVLIAMRMSGPRDVAAIDEWIRLHAEEEEARTLKKSLPSLTVGTAWVWAPGYPQELVQVKVRKRTTFDSSSTPKVGQSRLVPKKMAQIDLVALGDQIASAAEEAEANDPKVLQARVKALQAEVVALKRSKGAAAVTETVEVKVEVPVNVPALTDDQAKALSDLADVGRTLLESATVFADATARVDAISEDLAKSNTDLIQQMVDRPKQASRPAPTKQVTARQKATTSARTATAAPSSDVPSTSVDTSGVLVKAGARRMLEALASNHPLRLTQSQVHTLARMRKSGTSSTYWSTLRRAGFLDEDGHDIGITQSGLDFLGVEPGNPMSPDELRQQYRTILKAGAVRMFDHLVAIYPDSDTKEGIAEAAEMEISGTFSTYLSTLRRNGLITVQGGQVRAADILFGVH